MNLLRLKRVDGSRLERMKIEFWLVLGLLLEWLERDGLDSTEVNKVAKVDERMKMSSVLMLYALTILYKPQTRTDYRKSMQQASYFSNSPQISKFDSRSIPKLQL